ncbi:kinase-like domain-containing protein [Blakeslea trispora]|nr:kinase-like domain-containing protein [Blakeslea trispora]
MTLVGLLRGANANDKHFLAGIHDSQKTMKLGRNMHNDVTVYCPFISDVHCEIHTSSNGDITNVYLTDKSENGTFFNGSLIGYNQSVILYSGSIISFVSSHLNLLYIQVDKPFSREDNFDVVLQRESPKDSKYITVTSKPIGRGAESEILLAYESSDSRHEIVCKLLRKAAWKKITNRLATETEFLKRTRHPNVVSLIGNCANPKSTWSECCFFPLYAGGSLYERIKRKEYLEEDEASFLFFQILHGLKYIHSQRIIHCDIKAENIFLSSQSDRTRAVIGDFGLAKRNNGNLWADEHYGTWNNHAPEIVNQEQYDERIDVWSAGIVLYLMLSGDHPFLESSEFRNRHIKNFDEVRDRIVHKDPLMRRERIKACSPEAHHLILLLLKRDSKERCTASEALKDAFFLRKAVTDQQAFFQEYQTYVREDFNRERSYWFDEKIDETQSERNRCEVEMHPDDNAEEVATIIELRSSDSVNPIFKAKQVVKFDPEREDEIFSLAMSERYPKASFRASKLSSVLSDNTDDDSKSDKDEQEFSVCAV